MFGACTICSNLNEITWQYQNLVRIAICEDEKLKCVNSLRSNPTAYTGQSWTNMLLCPRMLFFSNMNSAWVTKGASDQTSKHIVDFFLKFHTLFQRTVYKYISTCWPFRATAFLISVLIAGPISFPFKQLDAGLGPLALVNQGSFLPRWAYFEEWREFLEGVGVLFKLNMTCSAGHWVLIF